MAKKKDKKTSISTGTIAKNKKAFYNFEIVEKIEAGVSLKGSEVKSLRVTRSPPTTRAPNRVRPR